LSLGGKGIAERLQEKTLSLLGELRKGGKGKIKHRVQQEEGRLAEEGRTRLKRGGVVPSGKGSPEEELLLLEGGGLLQNE